MKTETELKKVTTLACQLSDQEQVRRMNELHQTIFKKITRTIAHPTSYELVFDKTDNELISELAEFIKFERQCCPWLIFRLTFQAEEGPISLEMGDSVETKEMVYLVMELDKLHQ
jgi:hypothetical protein